MIDFKKTEDSIRELKKHDSLTLEDALGVYLDLCLDIKKSGTSIDRLSIGEPAEALGSLTRSGRTFLTIIRRNADQIRAADIEERLRKQESQLEDIIGTLTGEEEKLKTATAELEQAIESERERRASCEEQRLTFHEKKKELASIQKECDQMQEEIDSLSRLSLEPVKERQKEMMLLREQTEREIAEKKEELAAENRKAEADINRRKDEIRQEEARQEEELRRQREALESQLEMQREKLLQQKKSAEEAMTAARQKFRDDVQTLEKELMKEKADYDADRNILQAEIESLKTERQNSHTAYLEKQKILEADRRKKEEEQKAEKDAISQLEETIRVIVKKNNDLKEERASGEKTKAYLKQQQSKLNANVLVLQDEIDRLQEHLKNSDAASLQAACDRLRNENRQAEEDLIKARQQHEEEQAELKNRQEELQALCDLRKKERSVLIDQNEEMQRQIDILNKEKKRYQEGLENLTFKRSEADERLKKIEMEYAQQKSWFQSLEAQNYEKRLKSVQEKTRLFREVQEKLFNETDNLGMMPVKNHQAANQKREELRQKMEDLERDVEHYSRTYKQICVLLADGD